MKTRISAVTVAVLTIGTALVIFTASFLVHAVTPNQGDAVSGVDVSIEPNAGGAIIASTQTDANGVATFANIAPGKYIVRTKYNSSRTSSNYNSSRSSTAGIANATILSGTLNFSGNVPGKATIEVTGNSPKTLTIYRVGRTEPDAQRSTPSHRAINSNGMVSLRISKQKPDRQ